MHSVRPAGTDHFLRSIHDDVTNGCTFVWLLGAGISRPSGIPVAAELRRYVARCLGMALALGERDSRIRLLDNPDDPWPWDPRTDAWPNVWDDCPPSTPDYEKLITKFQLDDLKGRPPGDNARGILAEARGAIADWRTALLLLARLRWEASGPEEGAKRLATLTELQPEVIDTFFLHVVRGCKPCIDHHMVAHTARLLRVPRLLTTNFDELIEQAFAHSGKPLKVFDVHYNAALPSARIVTREARALVKIHGGRFGLRADYTLDATPSIDDRRRFTGYVWGKPISRHEWEEPFTSTDTRSDLVFPAFPGETRRLIVAGQSGYDRRTCTFINTALRRIRGLQVYWVCFDEDTVAAAKYAVANRFSKRVQLLQHPSLGLLLLELHQRMTGSLPDGGVGFPALPHAFTAPICGAQRKRPDGKVSTDEADSATRPDAGGELRSEIDPDISEDAKRLEAKLQNCRRHGKSALCVVTSEANSGGDGDGPRHPPASYGVTSVCAEVYRRRVAKRRKCLWFDMDLVGNTDDLFEQLTLGIARQVGRSSWLPAAVEEDPVRRMDELRQHIAGIGDDWTIFLNGRQGFGVNVDASPHKKSHDVIVPPCRRDVASSTLNFAPLQQSWNKNDWRRFWQLLQSLADHNPPMMTVVVMLQPDMEADRTRENHVQRHVVAPGLAKYLRPEYVVECTLKKLCPMVAGCGSPEVIAPNDEAQAARFIYAITLMRRPQFLAALVTWGVFGDSDAITTDSLRKRIDQALEWLRILLETGAVRYKEGGIYWMDDNVRRRFRKEIENVRVRAEAFDRPLGEPPDPPGDCQTFPLRHVEPVIHQSTGDWYFKLFLVSGDPGAALESTHHRIAVVEAILAASQERQDLSRCDVRGRRISSLTECTSALRAAAGQVRSRGYTAGTCAQLDVLAYRAISLAAAHPRLCPHIQFVGQSRREPAEQADERFEHELLRLLLTCGGLAYELAMEIGVYRRADVRLARYRDLILIAYPTGRQGTPWWSEVRAASRQLTYWQAATKVRELSEDAAVRLRAAFRCLGGRQPAFVRSQEGSPNHDQRRSCVQSVRDEAAQWAGEQLLTDPDCLYWRVRLCRRLIYQRTLAAEVDYVCSKARQNGARPAGLGTTGSSYLLQATDAYHYAGELLRVSHHRGVDSPRLHSDEIAHEHCVLRAYLGVALAGLKQATEAKRRFAEARAFHSLGSARDHHFVGTVIDLCDAESHVVTCMLEMPELAALRHTFWDCFKRRAIPPNDVKEKQAKIGGNVQAFMADAGMLIRKAEARMLAHRQNVWWWSRLSMLGLKRYEYMLLTFDWCDLRDSAIQEPPNGFGPGEAPLSAGTDADRLMSEVVRVTRECHFILARSLESYIVCLSVLWVARNLLQHNEHDRRTQQRPSTQRDMAARLRVPLLSRRLERAAIHLDTALTRLRGAASVQPTQNSDVCDYVRCVIEKGDAMLARLGEDATLEPNTAI
jgi:hypothetical protein